MAKRTLTNGVTTLPVGYETADRKHRYWVRTDGVILTQWRNSDGVLSSTHIGPKFSKKAMTEMADLARAFQHYCQLMGATEEVKK